MKFQEVVSSCKICPENAQWKQFLVSRCTSKLAFFREQGIRDMLCVREIAEKYLNRFLLLLSSCYFV